MHQLPDRPGVEAFLEAYRVNGSRAEDVPQLQRDLTQCAEAADAQKLERTLSNRDRALLLANSGKWSSAWLCTIPTDDQPGSSSLGLRLGLMPHHNEASTAFAIVVLSLQRMRPTLCTVLVWDPW